MVQTDVRSTAMEDSMFERQLLLMLPALKQWTRRFRATKEEREDLVQDTLLLAWSKRRQFDGSGSLKSWLSAILNHRAIDLLRSRTAFPTEYLEEHEVLVTIDAPQEQHCEYEEAMRILPHIAPTGRKTFLFSVLGHSDTEIASLENLPLGTVKARIRRTRMTLKERLAYA